MIHEYNDTCYFDGNAHGKQVIHNLLVLLHQAIMIASKGTVLTGKIVKLRDRGRLEE